MSFLLLSPADADLSGPTVRDATAPEGLFFHYADEAKPLATPWQVAVERAKMVLLFFGIFFFFNFIISKI